jgi:hypothetical protein
VQRAYLGIAFSPMDQNIAAINKILQSAAVLQDVDGGIQKRDVRTW